MCPPLLWFGDIVYSLLIIKITHLHCKIFRELREVEKKNESSIIAYPKENTIDLFFRLLIFSFTYISYIYIFAIAEMIIIINN